MKYDVTLYYFYSSHLNQIYDGFARLEKKGICRITYKKVWGDSSKPILYAIINGKRVLYDTLDGLNWLDGKNTTDNIQFFATNDWNVDYYFKRSYSKVLESHVRGRFQYFPLGLNYDLYPIYMPISKQRIKDFCAHSKIVEKFLGKKRFYVEDFVQLPNMNGENKILFLTRLWNPSGFEGMPIYDDWMNMNLLRVDCIKRCRDYFGEKFIGGIHCDNFSTSFCSPNLLVSSNISKRDHFLKLVKNSNICVATKGLFDSIGWKFAEYVAASRAIVTEPLNYSLPGNIRPVQNYLEFTNSDELIESIETLLDNTTLMRNMMINNHNYYIDYLQSDKLVLNTLLNIT